MSNYDNDNDNDNNYNNNGNNNQQRRRKSTLTSYGSMEKGEKTQVFDFEVQQLHGIAPGNINEISPHTWEQTDKDLQNVVKRIALNKINKGENLTQIFDNHIENNNNNQRNVLNDSINSGRNRKLSDVTQHNQTQQQQHRQSMGRITTPANNRIQERQQRQQRQSTTQRSKKTQKQIQKYGNTNVNSRNQSMGNQSMDTSDSSQHINLEESDMECDGYIYFFFSVLVCKLSCV